MNIAIIDEFFVFLKEKIEITNEFENIFNITKKEFISNQFIYNDIKYCDIDLFYNSSKNRAFNYINNRKREEILFILSEIKRKYNFLLNDEKWNNLYIKFNKIISTLIDIKFDSFILIKKGGRIYNYDFEILFYKKEKIIYKIEELEFKNGDFKKIPQQLSLQINSEYGCFIKNSYDEYFYENYLKKILKLYSNYNLEIHSLLNINDYKKNLKSINYDSSEIFSFLKKYEDLVKNEKSILVDKSIHRYLKNIKKDMINFQLIEKKLISSQSNKTYLSWNGIDFNIDFIKMDSLILNGEYSFKYGKNKLINTLVLHTKNPEKSWELLLRWRNRKGILNPAWQIKLKKD